jgi:hypothetical protein
MEDGSVCMWDLREAVFPHREVAREAGVDEWVIRSQFHIQSNSVITNSTL